MARKVKKKKVSSAAKALWTLVLLVVICAGSLLTGRYFSDATLIPKFALDLEGGTQLILTPVLSDDSEEEITQEDIQEAISIIRQRIDASGVTEAEISTMGTSNIVVSIPGKADQDTLDLVRSTALMNFRPVLAYTDAASVLDEDNAFSYSDQDGDGVLSDEMTGEPEDNSSEYYITEQLEYEFWLYDCSAQEGVNNDTAENSDQPIIACDEAGEYKYILGPVDVPGTTIESASATAIYNSNGYATGEYGVDIVFDEEGTELFAEASSRLYELSTYLLSYDDTRCRFAVVLDGVVISAPIMNAEITNGEAQITGSYTVDEAKELANKLNFGSLPLNFEVQSEQSVSATLGSSHLKSGVLAGVIGLILVVLYLMYQYRGLALVAAGSLGVAALLTYLVITILSWTMGYRLSLAGVAGLIVAVGITADSFIVYFERIRDEVRDGRLLSLAVEDGWRVARRTILASDAVNLLAAVVLYWLAVGGVQGFAFTLGVTTVVDLVVVFLFTHPLMSKLIRTRFFGEGHRLSGLDPEHLGAKSAIVYAGRGRIVRRGINATKTDSDNLHSKQAGEERVIELIAPQTVPDDGLSIAERRRRKPEKADDDDTSKTSEESQK